METILGDTRRSGRSIRAARVRVIFHLVRIYSIDYPLGFREATPAAAETYVPIVFSGGNEN